MKLVTIDNGYYKDFLGSCGLDVEVLKPTASPAVLYNKILDRESGWVGFIHSDVTCHGLVEAFYDTLEKHPAKAYGIVGPGPRWARRFRSYPVQTCDSCFIALHSDTLRFDSDTFDNFHLYVEDMALQQGDVRTLLIDGFEGFGKLKLDYNGWFIHHSKTLHKLGTGWGDYWSYRKKLTDKWGNVRTT